MHAICSIDDCEKSARTPGSAFCGMHYHRIYRHGRPDAHAPSSGITASAGRRYKIDYAPGHPIANKGGRVWEHRRFLYDEIGTGPHKCHWCQTALDWLPKGDPQALEVDHVNGVGDDNRIENLVPACRDCNTARAAQAKHDALVAAGYWSQHDTIAQLGQGRRPRVT